MYKWFIQEMFARDIGEGVGAPGQGKGGSHARLQPQQPTPALEGNFNLIPRDLWNTSCTLEFSGLPYSWTHQLPSRQQPGFLVVAAGKACAVGQGQSLERESHMCELWEAENMSRTEKGNRGGLKDLDEAQTVGTRQYF